MLTVKQNPAHCSWETTTVTFCPPSVSLTMNLVKNKMTILCGVLWPLSDGCVMAVFSGRVITGCQFNNHFMWCFLAAWVKYGIVMAVFSGWVITGCQFNNHFMWCFLAAWVKYGIVMAVFSGRVITGYQFNNTGYHMIGKGNPQWPQVGLSCIQFSCCVYTVNRPSITLIQCWCNARRTAGLVFILIEVLPQKAIALTSPGQRLLWPSL